MAESAEVQDRGHIQDTHRAAVGDTEQEVLGRIRTARGTAEQVAVAAAD